MSKEYIPLFLDFNDTTEDLSDEECGRLVRAIVDYANGNEPSGLITSGEKVAFKFLKGLVDRNAAISEKRSKARTGCNKEEEIETNDNKDYQNETNDNKTEQNESNSTTKTKTETKTENKNQNQKTNDGFDRFWTVYPRHVSKQAAKKAFDKLNPDEELLQTMISAVEKQRESEQWKKDSGQFIPHPATWINGRRWEDEVQQYKPQQRIVPAQNYTQRDYSHEDMDSGVQDMIKRFGIPMEGTG